jgi:hypothetical protein
LHNVQFYVAQYTSLDAGVELHSCANPKTN